MYSGLQEAPRLEDFGGDADAYGEAFADWRAGMLEASQQLGLVAGFVLSGGDAEDFSTILQTSQSVVANNYLTHAEEAEFSALFESCHVSRSQEACARLDELRDVSTARDEELEDCVGDHSDACVRARWMLANTAAEFLELALTSESQLDELGLLNRHMLFLQAHTYADDADAARRAALGLVSPGYTTAAEIFLTGTRDQIEDAIIDPISLGTMVFGDMRIGVNFRLSTGWVITKRNGRPVFRSPDGTICNLSYSPMFGQVSG